MAETTVAAARADSVAVGTAVGMVAEAMGGALAKAVVDLGMAGTVEGKAVVGMVTGVVVGLAVAKTVLEARPDWARVETVAVVKRMMTQFAYTRDL